MTGERVLRRHAAWLAVAAAYVIVFPYFEAINNPNENVRIWTTKAIVEHGTFAIDEVERSWGEVSDRALFGGRHYSSKAPGTSLLGVPVLLAERQLHHLFGWGEPSKRAATWALRLFTVALPLALFFFVFARRVERETGSPWARDLLLVGLGLGTMMYPYGLGFVGHAQSAALAFGSFLFITDARERSRSNERLMAGGLLAGLAVMFEYQTLLVAVLLAAFAVVEHRKRAAYFLLGALGPAALLGIYHTALFGRPWAFPYAYVDNPGYRMFHTAGFFGLARPRGLVLREAFVSVDYGLFVFSPFLALGLGAAATGAVREARRDYWLVIGVAVVMALFLAGMSNWRGGWCAGGPRYIAAVVPFLVWALALSWNTIWTRTPFASAALVAMVLISVGLCGLAGAHFPHYPLQFDNPIFDVTIRLLREGHVPYSLGWAVGLPGVMSYLPLALMFGLAVYFALAPRGRRPADVLGSVVLAAFCLFLLSLPGRGRSTEEEHALIFVRGAWEPPRAGHGTF